MTDLSELPEPAFFSPQWITEDCYSKAQMSAYAAAAVAEMRAALDALLEVAEHVVDTRTCSVGILRAMNAARKHLKPNV